MVLLANEFLKQEKQYVDEGVHPRYIIKAIRKAVEIVGRRIDELAPKVRHSAYNLAFRVNSTIFE